MKKLIISAAIAAAILSGCSLLEEEKQSQDGSLRIMMDRNQTKAGLPDTDNFRLVVTGPDKNVVYDGRYCDSPSVLTVSPGTYCIEATSCDFSSPAFSKPQYGATEYAVVKAGAIADVTLVCTQMNSGIVIRASKSMESYAPGGWFNLKSSQGTLKYSFTETRPAYFSPGSIAVSLVNSSKEETLFTKSLSASEMLSVGVSAPSDGSSSGSSVVLSVDTTCTWTSYNYNFGSSSGGSDDIEDAIYVADVSYNAGKENVWVYGYIVGSMKSSSSFENAAPFSSNTNICLSSRTMAYVKEECVCVELRAGAIRDALNLQSNPSLLGKKVYVKGNIVSAYYGLPGVKGVSQYKL